MEAFLDPQLLLPEQMEVVTERPMHQLYELKALLDWEALETVTHALVSSWLDELYVGLSLKFIYKLNWSRMQRYR